MDGSWNRCDGSRHPRVRKIVARPMANSLDFMDHLEGADANEATTGLAEFVRAAADGWDGSDPIRSLLG